MLDKHRITAIEEEQARARAAREGGEAAAGGVSLSDQLAEIRERLAFIEETIGIKESDLAVAQEGDAETTEE